MEIKDNNMNRETEVTAFKIILILSLCHYPGLLWPGSGSDSMDSVKRISGKYCGFLFGGVILQRRKKETERLVIPSKYQIFKILVHF